LTRLTTITYLAIKFSLMKVLVISFSILIFAFSGYSQSTPYVHITEEEQNLVDDQIEKPSDYKTNYNLAVHYYTGAVALLSAKADGSLPGVEGIDNELVRLFNAALNPALSAYAADKKNEIVLSMLSGIYFGIGEMDAKEKIDKELKKLSK
jgi:hypothetical protein